MSSLPRSSSRSLTVPHGTIPRLLTLALAAGIVIAGGSGCGSGGGGSAPAAFPTYPACSGSTQDQSCNTFSIQYRNSTSDAITVWFTANKPPCSYAEAQAGRCDGSSQTWADMSGAFAASGTAFFIVRTSGAIDKVAISNAVQLARGEILRILPPIGTDGTYVRPEWYYWDKLKAVVETSGTSTWVTKAGLSVPAPQQMTLYEFFVGAPSSRRNINYDISAVDGVNSNATMAYSGCSPAQPKRCLVNLKAYDGSNDGCPYIAQWQHANVCPAPKFFPDALDDRPKPAWYVSHAGLTAEPVNTTYPTYWANAGSPTGQAFAEASGKAVSQKEAYHIWWAGNAVAQGWTKYVQNNRAGTCDVYTWAYDEKLLDLSQCDPRTQNCFDAATGDPLRDNPIKPNVDCPYSANTYLNIDILDVM